WRRTSAAGSMNCSLRRSKVASRSILSKQVKHARMLRGSRHERMEGQGLWTDDIADRCSVAALLWSCRRQRGRLPGQVCRNELPKKAQGHEDDSDSSAQPQLSLDTVLLRRLGYPVHPQLRGCRMDAAYRHVPL